jgi:ferredoxin
MGVFSEDLYDYVKKLVEACPEKALIIEKIK